MILLDLEIYAIFWTDNVLGKLD